MNGEQYWAVSSFFTKNSKLFKEQKQAILATEWTIWKIQNYYKELLLHSLYLKTVSTPSKWKCKANLT